MTALGWERSGIALALYFAALAAGRFRAGRKQQVLLKAPLFDAAVLEAALHPRFQDGDDAALLAQLRDKFTALNRQAHVEEFFALHTQIAALSRTLTPFQVAVLRRALLRLLMSGDRSLQLVGAQIAADLGMTEAVAPLQTLSSEDAWDSRSRKVLEDALTALTGAVPHA